MARNAQAPKQQPGAMAVRRNAPAGDFIDHFMSPGDNRTHTERINPLDNGESFGWSPGANRGFQPQPLQTFNISDQPIGVQIAGPPIVVASEPEVAPLEVATEPLPDPVPDPGPQDETIMSDDAVEAIAVALTHGRAEIAAAEKA